MNYGCVEKRFMVSYPDASLNDSLNSHFTVRSCVLLHTQETQSSVPITGSATDPQSPTCATKPQQLVE